MRRPLVILFALLAFSGTALAGGWVASTEDGTLSVRSADGTIWMKANGALVGRFDQGSIRIYDPSAGDQLDVSVWGQERSRGLPDGATTIYGGSKVRFRIVGRFRIKIVADGIDLSAVGQGRIGMNGDAGTYSLNGKTRRSLPNETDGSLTFADLGLPDSG